jgi:hypothetical protein
MAAIRLYYNNFTYASSTRVFGMLANFTTNHSQTNASYRACACDCANCNK